ncbi:YdcF family protein [Actinoplanes sp. NPDC049596]|uniref:YdcF family protein n=1 Tax=unclassified Actinoplanes TaxID=2626549 RepID=UPI00342DD4D1
MKDAPGDFRMVAGTAGLGLDDVAHVLVPGRGRDHTGCGLTAGALDRVAVAQALFDRVVRRAQGRVVCSGYKSPIDQKGTPWRSDDAPDRTYRGVPEAELMRRELLRRGVPADAVRAERESIDTVTNFLRAELEGHFGDARPVAIVAQEHHLHRMIAVIAPRTLRRAYLGVIVPEKDPQAESPLATLASRLIVTALPRKPGPAIQQATIRAEVIWRTARLAGMRRYH